jgi:hypothetical protein
LTKEQLEEVLASWGMKLDHQTINRFWFECIFGFTNLSWRLRSKAVSKGWHRFQFDLLFSNVISFITRFYKFMTNIYDVNNNFAGIFLGNLWNSFQVTIPLCSLEPLIRSLQSLASRRRKSNRPMTKSVATVPISVSSLSHTQKGPTTKLGHSIQMDQEDLANSRKTLARTVSVMDISV